MAISLIESANTSPVIGDTALTTQQVARDAQQLLNEIESIANDISDPALREQLSRQLSGMQQQLTAGSLRAGDVGAILQSASMLRQQALTTATADNLRTSLLAIEGARLSSEARARVEYMSATITRDTIGDRMEFVADQFIGLSPEATQEASRMMVAGYDNSATLRGQVAAFNAMEPDTRRQAATQQEVNRKFVESLQVDPAYAEYHEALGRMRDYRLWQQPGMKDLLAQMKDGSISAEQFAEKVNEAVAQRVAMAEPVIHEMLPRIEQGLRDELIEQYGQPPSVAEMVQDWSAVRPNQLNEALLAYRRANHDMSQLTEEQQKLVALATVMTPVEKSVSIQSIIAIGREIERNRANGIDQQSLEQQYDALFDKTIPVEERATALIALTNERGLGSTSIVGRSLSQASAQQWIQALDQTEGSREQLLAPNFATSPVIKKFQEVSKIDDSSAEKLTDSIFADYAKSRMDSLPESKFYQSKSNDKKESIMGGAKELFDAYANPMASDFEANGPKTGTITVKKGSPEATPSADPSETASTTQPAKTAAASSTAPNELAALQTAVAGALQGLTSEVRMEQLAELGITASNGSATPTYGDVALALAKAGFTRPEQLDRNNDGLSLDEMQSGLQTLPATQVASGPGVSRA